MFQIICNNLQLLINPSGIILKYQQMVYIAAIIWFYNNIISTLSCIIPT